MFLDLLRSSQGAKLLRVKGLVALAEDPEHPVVIHGVQHVIHVPAVLARWPSEDRRSRIVFIVDDLERDTVEKLWNAFLGRPADRSAGRGGVVGQPAVAAAVSGPFSLPLAGRGIEGEIEETALPLLSSSLVLLRSLPGLFRVAYPGLRTPVRGFVNLLAGE